VGRGEGDLTDRASRLSTHEAGSFALVVFARSIGHEGYEERTFAIQVLATGIADIDLQARRAPAAQRVARLPATMSSFECTC
jgi:hypothetical protein